MPKIQLNYNDEIILELPNGEEISLVLSYLEPDEQHPELDIVLPKNCYANCFAEDFEPAKQPSGAASNILDCRQIIIPIKL